MKESIFRQLGRDFWPAFLVPARSPRSKVSKDHQTTRFLRSKSPSVRSTTYRLSVVNRIGLYMSLILWQCITSLSRMSMHSVGHLGKLSRATHIFFLLTKAYVTPDSRNILTIGHSLVTVEGQWDHSHHLKHELSVEYRRGASATTQDDDTCLLYQKHEGNDITVLWYSSQGMVT